ncbi:hypothetical protein E3N88_00779 [Mikania micrantha]|uniref:Retrovirus-related Pol polyprotein from transposon TNT 1-94-like beta-barrel domain-containing protein n=1 Tax=Mikania micrantha TaxID=192012 RepID=A0A5N6PZU4_9ASTR|nr:hypothetical protein E3N88_00779 [Mikania micrantha]
MDKLHPALTITNIRNAIPFVLEMDSGQYTSWAELFRVHCRACEVSDHIDPAAVRPPPPAAVEGKPAPVDLWPRLDATVLQWIYSTISNDLLHTIIKPNATACQAWIALQNIFQDNQNSRAIYLENKLVTTRLENFPNVSAYCQTLKMLSDQLANVNAPVSNQRLVLQLIHGLTESYESFATMLQQTTPLPDFYEARSRLILEETRKAHLVSNTTASPVDSALHTSTPPTHTQRDRIHPQSSVSRGRGRGSRARGRGRSIGGRTRGNSGWQHQPMHSTSRQPQIWPANNSWNYYPLPTWTYPPCPFPTQASRPPIGSSQPYPTPYPPSGNTPTFNHGPGILGPRPSQAYAASETSYTPTDLEQAFHTMALNPPDNTWYADTGATSHMTHSSGTLTSYVNKSPFRNIIVGNGSHVPIHGSGHHILSNLTRPLHLYNVLHVPNLIKNLLYIRRFTTDNNLSIEFDPFGFDVKDFPTRTPILRCNSSGDLYPFTFNSYSQHTSPAAFTSITKELWHHRLGHPGASILSSMKNTLSFKSSIYGPHRFYLLVGIDITYYF